MLSGLIEPAKSNLLTLDTPREGLFTLKLSVFLTFSEIFAFITDDSSSSFDNKDERPIPSLFFPIFVIFSAFFGFVLLCLVFI